MGFQTTLWSVVEKAQDRGEAANKALELLCETYWQPLFQHARRRGMSEEEAKDAVQGFFLCVIEKRYFDMADSSKGRFRTFLLTCFQRFLAKAYTRATAQKRDGNVLKVRIDWDIANSDVRELAVSDPSPEVLYDRAWAQALIARAVKRLRSREISAGRRALLDALGPTLFERPDSSEYEKIAADLGTTAGAVKVAAHRLRKRLRSVIREEVRATLKSGELIDDELKYLLDAVADT